MVSKFAAKLDDGVEYAVIWGGQSNATPNGTHNEGFGEDPHLTQKLQGVGIEDLVIVTGTGTETIVLPVSLTGSWIGAELRVGTPAAPSVGYGTVTAETFVAGVIVALTVAWTKAATPATVDAYLHYRDARFSKYDRVRVLTTFLPDQGGAYAGDAPVAPGFTVPATITQESDLGVFLPFTLFEGIEGYGISNVDGGGVATGAAATTFDWTTAVTAGVFAGGYIRVRHEAGVSWSEIADNTANQATGLSWSGVAYSVAWGATPANWTYDIWLPHYLDNPHAYLPGPGFLYPSAESQPLGAVHNRPRGNTTYGYGLNRWGAMLSFASRVADAIGRRVNVIPLAIDGSSLVSTWNLVGGTQHGWAGPTTRFDWHPQNPNGLAARMSRLIRAIAPAANGMDGNTKPLRIIGMSGFFGESESTRKDGREQAKNVFPMFWNWLRNEVWEAGLCPYESKDQIPFVHPILPTSPWELPAPGGGDTDGQVNAAILNMVAKTWFAGTIDTNDSPQKPGEEIHFNGVGEAINGKLVAEKMVELIDAAYSVQLDVADPGIIEICNLALSHVGAGKRITSLAELSAEAKACALFFPVCLEILLQRCPWSFSTRRLPLLPVTDARDDEWTHAYGYPTNAVRVFKVLPPGAGSDDVGLRFETEQDDDGHRIIYTTSPDAIANFNVLVVDTSVYPPLFVDSLSQLIGAKLAGHLVKGGKGIELAKSLERRVMIGTSEAATNDAQQRDPTVKDWIPGAHRARRGG